MGQKDYIFATNKLHVGPGGWNCSCCSPMHPNKDRKMIQRLFRRTMKQKIKKFLELE